MKYQIVCVGSIKEKYFTESILEYKKRISRFADISIVEVEEEKLRGTADSEIERVLQKEGERILAKCQGTIVLCDLKGKMLDSIELSDMLEKMKQTSSVITFVIGGSYGLSEEVRCASSKRISFSPMTFPHQLMRVILLEQLYRSETIAHHITYHK